MSPVRGNTSVNVSVNMEHIVNDKGLHVLYYNARSVLSKMDELRATMSIQQPHIVCVVETWLSPDILDNELHINDYQLVRLDRDRHGGGVLMYVHLSISFKIHILSGPYNLEFISISILSGFISSSICVCLFYRPPSSPIFVLDSLFLYTAAS